MNKIYKVVRCQSTGQSIVVSELAKGQGKTKVKAKGIRMPFKATLALVLGSVGSVWAGCPPLSGAGSGEINCYGSDEAYVANDGDSFTRLRVNATTGKGSIVLNNNTFNNTTNNVSVGVSADLGNVSIDVNGNNLITSADATATALWAVASAGGDARISIAQDATLTIENKNFGSNTGDGIEVNGKSGFVEHSGSGKITVYGGHGVFATATGVNGIADVKLGKNVVIETQGNGNNGIDAHTSSSGTINIANDAQISTLGDNAKGIFANGLLNNGGVTVTNTGNISTTGASSDGIRVAPLAVAPNPNLSGSGKITINNSGNISTNNTGVQIGDRGAHAIYAIIDNNGTVSQGIDINQTGGTLTTTGYDSHGVLALTDAASGDINITVSGTDIDVKHRNSDAIDVQRMTSGNINDVSNVNINVTTNGGEFKLLDSTVAPSGGSNFGIVAIQYDAAAGDIKITNNGTKISTGTGADGSGASSDAIRASFVNNTATGNAYIMNNGVLSAQAAQANAITAINNGSGTITVINKEALSVGGNDSSAIKATSTGGTGDILIYHERGATITSTGNTVAGSRTDAISAFKNVDATGDITIYVDGDISTNATNRGAAAYAQHQGVGNATVIGTGNITASASYAGTNIYSYGLAATVSDSINAAGNATVGYSRGTIRTGGEKAYALYAGVVGHYGNTVVENSGTLVTTGNDSHGIWARNETINPGSATSGGASVFNTGNITASGNDAHAIYANSTAAGEITLTNTGHISGGTLTGAGIGMASIHAQGNQFLNNTGNISALSDRAIVSTSAAGSSTIINNYGTLTGTVTLGDGDTTFTNYSPNSWNLRNFTDTNGDGIRDSKEIAIADFGLGNDTFINETNGTLRLAAVNDNTNVPSTAGEYLPAGALSITNAGTVHGQLLNLDTFDNKGKIDLTDNQQAGDVLVISGNTIAGTYNPAAANTYVSNGGSLHLDSVMNKGGSISQSDILVLDDVSMGAGGATKVHINAVSGNGELTEGDGIKIIEVLGNQRAGAFASAAPITYGLYEYILAQGSGANANNWFLQNAVRNNGTTTALISPVVGAYLGTQYAAGHMFTQSIVDRRDAVRAPDSDAWMRVNHNSTEMDTINSSQSTDIKSTMVQLGADIGRWGDTRLGLFGGYGNSKIDNDSKITGSKAEGKVDGYHLGVYGSWIPEADNNLYVDLWGQYAWFDNKLTGNAQQGKDIKYNSSAITLSAEAGYSFQVAQTENLNWMLEPHAQITYTFFNTDDFTDANNTRFSDAGGDGFRSRLGARIYGTGKTGVGVSPFIETNWLHDATDNKVKLLGQHNAKADSAKDLAEVKLGFEGHFNQNLSAWAHVGGQWGNKNFTRYEGQIGLGYKW